MKIQHFLFLQILATEQNPKGLGHTVPEIELQKHAIPVFEKTKVWGL